MKNEYILVTSGPVSREFIRTHIESRLDEYAFPCKFTIRYGNNFRSFYIEKSNVRDGVMIIGWNNIAVSMSKEWDRVS